MLELARQRDVAVHVLLTKADKLGRGAIAATARTVERELGTGVGVQAFFGDVGLGCQRGEAPPGRLAGRT
jgi:GTP-binding protein